MSKIKFELDNSLLQPVIGGWIAKLDNSDYPEFCKVLGMYKNHIETFNIMTKDIDIVDVNTVKVAKITIDGLDIAKESYRIFISDIEANFNYKLVSYHRKPKLNEIVRITDLHMLNSPIFNTLLDRNVEITSSYDKTFHGYFALTSTKMEIKIRRAQFSLLNNNTIDIAFLHNPRK